MGKNKETEANTHSSQKSAYVRYRIFSDDAKDVGVGIAVKRAIDSFVNNHGYESRVTIDEKTSDRFNIILQIFEGGNPDLMINALRDHIANSGRLPSNKKYKPTINIEPIPCDEGISIIQQPADHIGFQKEREGYLRTIDGKEEEVANLTRAIGARQKVIDEQSSRIKTLEGALNCSSPITEYTDPFDLLANAYLPKSIDDLIDASDDWETLLKSNDETFFTTLSEERVSYLIYLNKKFGLNFNSKEEFLQWKEKMSSFNSWQETPEAKEMTGAIAKIDADTKLYELARQNGATDETLQFLEKTVQANKPVYVTLKANAESSSKDFEESKRAYSLIESKDPEESYKQLMAVLGKSDSRSRRKSQLPIIATTKPGTDLKVLRFYLPTFDNSSGLEQHIHSLIESSIVPQGAYNLSQVQYSEQIRVLDIEAGGEKKLALDYSKIMQDPILNSLGLKPRILTVRALE